MPPFYFHAYEGDEIRDGDGQDLPDICSVRRVAVAYAGDLLKEAGDTLFDHDMRLVVTDGTGLTLFSILIVATEAPSVRS
ncbi:DUF6894 family protein [Sphingomonas profundi]|uniref:DUF6894 family protein n=1 Tax=Alterirhizorhabdus profundi TaxID=2681549 RepID=UPI003BAF4A00